MDQVIKRFQENDEYLMRLEKLINPLLDDDDLTALTYIFSEIMEKNVKTMQVPRDYIYVLTYMYTSSFAASI